MTEYPKGIKFKYSWRNYQQRALDDLQNHLEDSHLHVIAPPGSGKTVLGLEVALRLNKPTLILAPTLAIRNQWIQRFCELFLQTTQPPDWISSDIRNPKFMTVATYQGLHAACNSLAVEEDDTEDGESPEENGDGKPGNPNLDNIINGFKSQNIKTIVVDEAHHLKNEWWQTLAKVKERISPIIVGLTATPPYDVTMAEWQRYIGLNGPVDTEISIPELVAEGDLCPHQDYVCFTLPADKEKRGIVDFRRSIERLFRELSTDETLAKAVENHPVWLNPAGHLEWIYNNLSFYSSCLIFLNANKREISKAHLEVIGDRKLQIPKLDYGWMETLLDFYLYNEKTHFKAYEEHQKMLEDKLRRHGAIERRKINFSYNKKITNLLTSSIGKLDKIAEIVEFEHKQLRDGLRLVILSDFIRKEFLINASENNLDLNKIGVIPIFEKLRRGNAGNIKIGVLTGSLLIIPMTACPAFDTKAAGHGITQINKTRLPFDNSYILINQTGQLKHDMVHIITQIFQQGEIEVLIGTKSLLGEGWDAPAINSLILASFVGSFVLSNQMRGRAIRAQNGNQGKTGNIWHLVCIDPTTTTGGNDFDLLKRRFRGFAGLSLREEPSIESGIDRLNLPRKFHRKEEIEEKNAEMFLHAGDRKNLKQRWEAALKTGRVLVEEIKIPFREERGYEAVKSMYFKKTIACFMASLSSGVLAYLGDALHNFGDAIKAAETVKDYLFIFAIIGIGGVLFFGRQACKALKLYLKYRDISKDIQQIGNALLNSLAKAGAIHTDISRLEVAASIDKHGAVYCHLKGGNTFEKSTFINALQEILSPVGNPRYVIIRKSGFMLLIRQKDYHSVPESLGQNKNLAEYFKTQWESRVGACNLIFTRTIRGRKLLIKSRMKSLSAQFADKMEYVNKWK
jgi:superfamily II DNA or RNA helicase